MSDTMLMLKKAVVLLLVILGSTQASKETIKQWGDENKRVWTTIKELAEQNATIALMVEEHFALFNSAPDIQQIPYDCSLPPSATIPTSAHEVRPGDIRVVASIGDSITAGYGITASDIIEVALNDRQESWIPGGQGSLESGVMTVTNMLRKFNPGIKGYSYAESWEYEREAGLNVAVGGAIAWDLYEEAEMLVTKMRDPSYNVNWSEDWKLVSLLIGGNDLCRSCYDTEFYSPANYAYYIQRAIDYLYHIGPPRMIVIVSNIFDVTPLPAFSESLVCDIFQGVACGCAAETDVTRELQRQYVAAVDDMISGRYDRPQRPDFTVVQMTHFNDAQPPKMPGTDEVDRSFWAPDCFHPGRKGHYAIATSQWNQLFEPVGQKRTTLDWQVATNLVCPTEADPYIRTNLNSGLKNQLAGEDADMHEVPDSQTPVIVATVLGSVGLLAIVIIVVIRKRRGCLNQESTVPHKHLHETPEVMTMETISSSVA